MSWCEVYKIINQYLVVVILQLLRINKLQKFYNYIKNISIIENIDYKINVAMTLS